MDRMDGWMDRKLISKPKFQPLELNSHQSSLEQIKPCLNKKKKQKATTPPVSLLFKPGGVSRVKDFGLSLPEIAINFLEDCMTIKPKSVLALGHAGQCAGVIKRPITISLCSR